jgi:hypothetical protein
LTQQNPYGLVLLEAAAVPKILIPRGVQGSRDFKSSIARATNVLPLATFLYLRVARFFMPLIRKYPPSKLKPSGETSGWAFV